MGVVKVKDGVKFDVIKPAGFRILGAIDQCTKDLDIDLRITSGTEGVHSGPTDPHKRGEAFDVGSQEHSTEIQTKILSKIMGILGFDKFYGFLESPGTDNEHFHIQVAKGVEFP